MKVCLDAGHGSKTPGKRSFDNSFFEYEFNRDIARRIKPILEQHGIEVVLTADTNEDISLSKRCQISNNAKADIFISIHANAFGSNWNDANGWEIYFSKGSVKGEELAKSIQDESLSVGLTDRGIKPNADFTVLQKTKAPAVLVEHFFYTNKTELTKCNTEEYRQRFAVADSKGILNYLGVKYQEAEKTAEIDYKELYEVEKEKIDKIGRIINS